MDDPIVSPEALHVTESGNQIELGGNGALVFHLETDLKDILASQKTELTESGTGNDETSLILLRGRNLDDLKKFVEQELQPGGIYVLLAVRHTYEGQQNAPTNILLPPNAPPPANPLSLTIRLNVPKK